ncbi:hypothetical protein [Halomarina rubra]|uniref:Ribbon-helix-helix protein CopG domain-containing protein n=1 Tax=Halomarina rubra TaxID=2071873 RepID=A0ABD6ARJ8_9EURY|nr:hypothetical protein [Halomarina rubra]
MMVGTQNLGVTMPPEMVEVIDQRRSSTKPRSEWIREAVEARLYLEDSDEWEELVQELEVSTEN